MRGRTLAAAALLLLGLGLLAWPAAARLHSERVHAELVWEQEKAAEDLGDAETARIRSEAEDWNALLARGLSVRRDGERTETDYWKLLNPAGDGLMGTLRIPALDLTLPVAHGTAPSTLERCAGHLEGSSLPVGGPGTHAVLSGHSGLAGSRLFSDLERLREGDVFLLRVLGEDLWYRVDRIAKVLPSDVSDLAIRPGEDLVTLVTCTPYAVNTHRLLVRGRRIPPPEEIPETVEERTVRTTRDAETEAVLTALSAIFLLTAWTVRRRTV